MKINKTKPQKKKKQEKKQSIWNRVTTEILIRNSYKTNKEKKGKEKRIKSKKANG